MALLEFVIIGLIFKQRRKTNHFAALHIAQIFKALDNGRKQLGLSFRTSQSTTARHKKMSIIRNDGVFVIKLKRFIEALAKFGQVLQRTTQERNMTANRTTTCQTGNGLRNNALENRCSNIFFFSSLVQKGLYVGLGEYATATSNRIQHRMMLSELIQPRCVSVQKRGHLIDECTGTTSARTVHALLDAIIEVDDLSVFAAKLNSNIGLGDKRFNCRFGSDNFLNEFDTEPLGKQQTTGASDGHRNLFIGELHCRFLQYLQHRCTHIGVMASIDRIDDLIVFVQNCNFYRG